MTVVPQFVARDNLSAAIYAFAKTDFLKRAIEQLKARDNISGRWNLPKLSVERAETGYLSFVKLIRRDNNEIITRCQVRSIFLQNPINSLSSTLS